jgi:acetylornithine deacetylase/succinyl-diaminopimelate desuccinylase-like protein
VRGNTESEQTLARLLNSGVRHFHVQSAIHDYVEKNKPRFLEELLAFLRIPSISTLPERKEDVAKAANFVRDSLTNAGLENVELIPTNG